MLYGRPDLVSDIQKWIFDKDYLDTVRQFLGGTGLNEAKVANWRKREPPETLVEGAALYHCSRLNAFDVAAAEITKLVAEQNWHVSVVSKERDEAGHHDLSLLRLWTGVRQYGQLVKNRTLTHKMRMSTGVQSSAIPEILDVMTGKPHADVMVMSTPSEESNTFESAVCWDIHPDTARDVGYSVKATGMIPCKATADDKNAFFNNALTNIPVSELHLVLCVPQSLLDESSDILEAAPFNRPKYLRFMNDNLAVKAISDFERQANQKPDLGRWLTPWFENFGNVDQMDQAANSFPKVVTEFLESAGVESMSETHVTFMVKIACPAPYLTHSLVLRLPE